MGFWAWRKLFSNIVSESIQIDNMVYTFQKAMSKFVPDAKASSWTHFWKFLSQTTFCRFLLKTDFKRILLESYCENGKKVVWLKTFQKCVQELALATGTSLDTAFWNVLIILSIWIDSETIFEKKFSPCSEPHFQANFLKAGLKQNCKHFTHFSKKIFLWWKYCSNNCSESLESGPTCLEKFLGTFREVFWNLRGHFPHAQKSLPTKLNPTVVP